MVGLAAAPFINVLLRLLMEPKTDYRRLPSTRATAFFSYYDISIGHVACLTTKRARRESSLRNLAVHLSYYEKGIQLKRPRGKSGRRHQLWDNLGVFVFLENPNTANTRTA